MCRSNRIQIKIFYKNPIKPTYTSRSQYENGKRFILCCGWNIAYAYKDIEFQSAENDYEY